VRLFRFALKKQNCGVYGQELRMGNTASCKILEKCGFKEEGLVRQRKMMHAYCNYYMYGYIKDDYSAI